jgi:transcription-repair coupling factor (superfamily II helicase)
MILPFVREIFAELEHSSAFERVRRHLSLGAGRRRVSGLTATARALYIPLLARAARQPVIVVVADNKAAETLEPLLKAGCELTGAIDPATVVRLPAHDVLPFENLSPHPDVQEQRASALWKLATGAVSILIAPVEAAALRLFDRDYYAGLAVTLKRGEEVDVEVLTGHLASVGYAQMVLVEDNSRAVAAFSMFTRLRPTAPFELNSSATRSRPSANSIRRRSARRVDWMKHNYYL